MAGGGPILRKMEIGLLAPTFMAENKNWTIFIVENVNIAYISTDFGHKNSDVNGDIIFRGSENATCQ